MRGIRTGPALAVALVTIVGNAPRLHGAQPAPAPPAPVAGPVQSPPPPAPAAGPVQSPPPPAPAAGPVQAVPPPAPAAGPVQAVPPPAPAAGPYQAVPPVGPPPRAAERTEEPSFEVVAGGTFSFSYFDLAGPVASNVVDEPYGDTGGGPRLYMGKLVTPRLSLGVSGAYAIHGYDSPSITNYLWMLGGGLRYQAASKLVLALALEYALGQSVIYYPPGAVYTREYFAHGLSLRGELLLRLPLGARWAFEIGPGIARGAVTVDAIRTENSSGTARNWTNVDFERTEYSLTAYLRVGL